MLIELRKLGLTTKQVLAEAGPDKLNGKSFLFTGALTKFSRDDAKELVESNGGKLLSSVSKNLDFLVVGENAGSKLDKARTIPTIQIIDEDAFLKMIE